MKYQGISSEKQKQLQLRMKSLGIEESDLKESFILGSGRGGQKVNASSSSVQLCYLPTTTIVKCQRSRHREYNRYLARKELCNRIELEQLGKESTVAKKVAKVQRQKQRRKRRSKKKYEDI